MDVVEEVDATFEDVDSEDDHEWDDGEEWAMGSAMSARDDGEVGMVVVMVREET